MKKALRDTRQSAIGGSSMNVFKDVADRCGVSEEEVRTEIEKSIAEACKDPDSPARKIGKGDIPTVEEVIEYVLNEVKKSQMS